MITPPAVDQRRIDTFFAGEPVRWHAPDVSEVARTIRKVVPAALDLHSLTQDADEFLENDGVHPSAAGQRRILTHVVEHLVTRRG